MNPEDEKKLYPGRWYQRVIVVKEIFQAAQLAAILENHEIVEPLKAGQESANGKYVSYGFCIMAKNHVEVLELDRAIRSLEGVKLTM